MRQLIQCLANLKGNTQVIFSRVLHNRLPYPRKNLIPAWIVQFKKLTVLRKSRYLLELMCQHLLLFHIQQEAILCQCGYYLLPPDSGN